MARKRTITPTRPKDARTQRSIEALSSAFLELLDSKPIDQIYIKEIVEVAGVSEPTFFRRFRDKEDLLHFIAAGEVKRLLSLGEAAISRLHPEEAAVDMCRYVQENRKLWTTLLTGGAASALREEFIRTAYEISTSRPRINPWLPAELAVSYLTSSIFEIFSWWMRQPDNYPLDNVFKIFNALVIDPVGRRSNIVLQAVGCENGPALANTRRVGTNPARTRRKKPE